MNLLLNMLRMAFAEFQTEHVFVSSFDVVELLVKLSFASCHFFVVLCQVCTQNVDVGRLNNMTKCHMPWIVYLSHSCGVRVSV